MLKIETVIVLLKFLEKGLLHLQKEIIFFYKKMAVKQANQVCPDHYNTTIESGTVTINKTTTFTLY